MVGKILQIKHFEIRPLPSFTSFFRSEAVFERMDMARQTNSARARRVRIPAEEFVQHWGRAVKSEHSYDELAQTLGMARQQVYSRARLLRAKGVDLPKLADGRRGRRALDVDHLNKILKDSLKSR